MSRQRYALLTVDTEALCKRATDRHVQRLIWGQHEAGTAGIREMCGIGDEFGAKHVFFTDCCGMYSNLGQMREVVSWLDVAGQDVQLHTHSETLPKSFWQEHGLVAVPRFMNQYIELAQAEFVLRYFRDLITDMTGKPVLAHRAGSFRWNALTIRALQELNIPLSFNQSMRALESGRGVHGEPDCLPYAWSNGVIEVPVTERWVPGVPGFRPDRWVSLTYPESPYFKFGSRPIPAWKHPFAPKPAPVTVVLLHSWSLLERDEAGHAVYRDDRLLEGYRKFLRRLVKDCEVITTAEFLELHAQGKIDISRTVNLEQVEAQV
ncbi:polysaccharide deacetylase [Alcaligenes faecalis]|uniref:polysaccharide deacetylase n=1 Tax=Alcaligenes faecalis TaxID=511 RepID=UPI00052B6AB5|nr:polysaccharide deacetylase [Alcaligenes faecalis]KGP02099.1 polysaccharide deacetylase [Alcaligenes faecalis]